MLEHSTGLSRGFGFITFDDEQAVDDLLSQDRTLELGGKQVPSISGRLTIFVHAQTFAQVLNVDLCVENRD